MREGGRENDGLFRSSLTLFFLCGLMAVKFMRGAERKECCRDGVVVVGPLERAVPRLARQEGGVAPLGGTWRAERGDPPLETPHAAGTLR